VVSLHSRVDDTRCPEFGFDAAGVVREVGESLPGLDLQAAIWDNGTFALAVFEHDTGSLEALLPLVDHADDVRDAAGLDPRQDVEINSVTLGLVIPADEHEAYLALLTALVAEHGVASYWADGGGVPVDGVESVQIAACSLSGAAIEHRIRASGLHIAESPVRFVPLP
jgi:hypothetical protein